MNPPIIEQQIEDSLNSLFGNEESLGGHKPVYASDSSLLKNEPEVMFSEKANAFFKILKMVFLFLPGAFFLYFSSIFFLYAFFVTKTSILDFGFGLALWALSVFMVVFGIGKIKDLKCLLVPASICAVPFILFMGSSLLTEATQVKFLFDYSAYLFPIALVASLLTKRLIDKTEN